MKNLLNWYPREVLYFLILFDIALSMLSKLNVTLHISKLNVILCIACNFCKRKI